MVSSKRPSQSSRKDEKKSSKFQVIAGDILDTPNQFHVKSSVAFLESQILKDAAEDQPFKTPVYPSKHGSSEMTLPI